MSEGRPSGWPVIWDGSLATQTRVPKKLPQMPFVRDKVDTRVTEEIDCPS